MTITAGVRHEMALAALLAKITMATQSRRATSQERTQNLPVVRGQLRGGRGQAEA